MIRIAGHSVGLVLPRAVFTAQADGDLARTLDQAAVEPQLRELQIAPPGLAGPEQLALAPKVEVDLGELESVGRLDERLQAPLCGLGELLDGP
jgi:hypothetical protein